jgi:hypothetical protein
VVSTTAEYAKNCRLRGTSSNALTNWSAASLALRRPGLEPRVDDRAAELLGLDLTDAVLGVLAALERLLDGPTAGAVADVVAGLARRREALGDRRHPSVLREIDEGQRRLRGARLARR